MSFNVTNLLLSLGFAMAQASGSTLGDDLFIHNLPASASNDSAGAAVLRIFGGPPEGELRPVPMVSVQCMTHALDASAGLQFAQRLYDALHDTAPGSSGGPRNHWNVVGKKIDANGDVVNDDVTPTWGVRLIGLTSGPPGIIGRGDASSGGRYEISFNFNVRFTAP